MKLGQHVVMVVDRETHDVIPLWVANNDEEAREARGIINQEQERLVKEYHERIQAVDFFDLTSTFEEEIGAEIMETAVYFWFRDMPYQIEDYDVVIKEVCLPLPYGEKQ